jgi:hypothetical protein
MNRKIPADETTFDRDVITPATTASKLKALRIGRFLTNRGTHHVDGAVVAKYLATRAHNSVLQLAGVPLQLEGPGRQPQIALDAWEDEGGKVRLQASRAKMKHSG